METTPAFSRILVPIDFSPDSQRAWDLAQRLGTTQGAELCLIHVLSATPIDVEARLRREEAKAESRAQAAAHQLAILRDDQVNDDEPEPAIGHVFHGPLTGEHVKNFSVAGCEWAAILEEWAAGGRAKGCKVQTELRSGTPAREILTAAQEYEADLIVIANHGHGNIHRLLIGSVADRIIRMAPCPVLTVKA